MLQGAFVNGVDVISQSYQITAQWTEIWLNDPGRPAPPPASGGYSLSSSDGAPLAASTTSADLSEGAWARIDHFSLDNHGYIFPPSQIIGGVYNGAYSVGGRFSSSAQGVWDFRPSGALLELNFAIRAQYEDPPDGGITVELTDMTTSTTLLDFVQPEAYNFYLGYGGIPSANYTFGVNPNNVYEFSIYAYGNTDGFSTDFGIDEDVAASITSVPDGGLTLGMLGVAMGGLAFIRRRFQS